MVSKANCSKANQLQKYIRSALAVLVLGGVFSLLITLIILAQHHSTRTDFRNLVWKSWDVTISAIDTTKNTFHVEEIHDLGMINGVFNSGERQIPLDRLVSIDHIQVFDGNTALTPISADPGHCPATAGVVCFAPINGVQDIFYNYLEPTTGSLDNRTIRFEYDVVGGIRSHSDGDQLWWKALADDRQYDVYQSSVTIKLPPDMKPQSVAMYATGDKWTKSTDSAQNLVFSAGNWIGSSNVEVRLQFPHNPALSAPPWQALFDAGLVIGPLASLALLILDGVIFIGGTVFALIKVIGFYRRRPRPVVPAYLTMPPSNLSPAAAGALIQGKITGRDIVATLIDLTQRGFIVIEQEKPSNLLQAIKQRLRPGSAFVLHWLRSPAGEQTRNHELTMLQNLFGLRTNTTRRLTDNRRGLRKMARLMGFGIKRELEAAGLFDAAATRLKKSWYALGSGCFLLALAIVGTPYLITETIPDWSIKIGFIAAWLTVVTWFIGWAIPIRTANGVEAAGQWRAFRNYLKYIRRYQDQDTELSLDLKFERYIGYAVAFKLGKQWLKACVRQLTVMPRWFYPATIYGGVSYSAATESGTISGSSLPQRLNAFNAGMTLVLNSAIFYMAGSIGVTGV